MTVASCPVNNEGVFQAGSGSESESEVAQSRPNLCDPMDCSLPGSSLHGILQARVLEWLPFSLPEDLPDPGMGEAGGLPSMGSHRVGHD